MIDMSNINRSKLKLVENRPWLTRANDILRRTITPLYFNANMFASMLTHFVLPRLTGSTRAFPPHHPLIPVDYQLTGQPVLIGGTMGTCSYVLTGTEKGMEETFGSTCHGAGRALSRAKSRRNLDYQDVLEKLQQQVHFTQNVSCFTSCAIG